MAEAARRLRTARLSCMIIALPATATHRSSGLRVRRRESRFRRLLGIRLSIRLDPDPNPFVAVLVMTVSSSGVSCLWLGRRSGSGKEGFRADDVDTVIGINELGDVNVAGGGD